MQDIYRKFEEDGIVPQVKQVCDFVALFSVLINYSLAVCLKLQRAEN
jgi:hypothetical protein